MPATEETFRRQPTLHLVFAISSIAMLLATVWMVMADHLRPWKQVQREFQLIERDKLNASEKEKQAELDTKYKSQLDQIAAKIEAANKSADERYSQIRALDTQISKLDATAEGLDMERRFKKTELDSKRSLYDGMIDRAEEQRARTYLSSDVA
jgi:biopolymer transport protein ExbB/TolQ